MQTQDETGGKSHAITIMTRLCVPASVICKHYAGGG
jgi:hypothetical protein